MIHLCEVFGGGNVIETERTVLARAWGMGSCYSMGTESRFCKIRKFWRWVQSNVSVLNTTVHLEMVNVSYIIIANRSKN